MKVGSRSERQADLNKKYKYSSFHRSQQDGGEQQKNLAIYSPASLLLQRRIAEIIEQDAHVLAKLSLLGLEQTVLFFFIQLPQRLPVRRNGPLENRHGDDRNHQNCQEGELKAGVPQIRRMKNQQDQPRRCNRIQQSPLTVDKPSEEINQNHQRGPHDRDASAGQKRKRDHTADDKRSRQPIRQANQGKHPEKTDCQRSHMKAGNHQGMKGAALPKYRFRLFAQPLAVAE